MDMLLVLFQLLKMVPRPPTIHYPGGTNVSGAVECPANEKRPVASMDMTDMDQILWIDEENLTAHIQAGIIGQDLERKVGVVLEPNVGVVLELRSVLYF